ncbi:unannotated protein [freshwater metagenome]|uniref:Unannotated protein n=1 Tax=freshwater metagenome TaxID=449393 RepID=A0A6J7IWN6_9ZZZZ
MRVDKTGAKVAIEKRLLVRLIKLDAIKSAETATMIGISAAVKLPKVMRRISSETRTAIISLVCEPESPPL